MSSRWFKCVSAVALVLVAAAPALACEPQEETFEPAVPLETHAPKIGFLSERLVQSLGSPWWLGGTISPVGDVDGDGVCDVAVTPVSGEGAGRVEIRSSVDGALIRIHALGSRTDLAYAGDVDGDGCDDYVLARGANGDEEAHVVRCISGKTGKTLSSREFPGSLGVVRLAARAVRRGVRAQPVGFYCYSGDGKRRQAADVFILDSDGLATKYKVPPAMGMWAGRGPGVLADWGHDGSLDLIVLESRPGNRGHGVSVYSIETGEFISGIEEKQLRAGPRGTDRDRSRLVLDEWGSSIVVDGAQLLVDGPYGSILAIGLRGGRVVSEDETGGQMCQVASLLVIEDLDGDEQPEVLVTGLRPGSIGAIGEAAVLSIERHERLSLPEVDDGDEFGLACLVRGESLLVLDGDRAVLELRDVETGKRSWQTESLGRDWSSGFITPIGDVDGDSHEDYAVSGLARGVPRWIGGPAIPAVNCRNWNYQSRQLRSGGGAVISGRTGESLSEFSGFGSCISPTRLSGEARESLVCLGSGEGVARFARLARGEQLAAWECEVGKGLVTIPPLVLSGENGSHMIAIAVNYMNSTTELVAMSVTSGEVLTRVSLEGLVTSALVCASGESLLATRLLSKGKSGGTSELVRLDDPLGECSVRVLQVWEEDWGTPVGLDDNGELVAVGFPRTMYRLQPDLELDGASTPSSGSGSYHEHRGRVVVLELVDDQCRSRQVLTAPANVKGFGEAVRFATDVDDCILAVGACDGVSGDWFGEVFVFRGVDELEFSMRVRASDD